MFKVFKNFGLLAALGALDMPLPVRTGNFPRHSRPAGYRAHRRWKKRRAAGRA